jgi:drug/metabolite transporter (DMT)-like permease
MPTPIEWLMLIGIGVLTQFAQLRMTQALHLEPAGRASAVTYLQVLLSVGWGIWLFGEQPSIFTLMGAVLVLGGTLIATGALPLPARWVTFWEAPVAIEPPAPGSDPHADADHDR